MIKALSKNVLIQTIQFDEMESEFLKLALKVLQQWPSDFESDLLSDVQRFLVLSEKEFRMHRTLRHQLRFICSLHLMRKDLLRQLQRFPYELHLNVRLLPTHLHFPFSRKPVLGLAVATHLSSAYESFEERHILLAIQKFFPSVRAVKESFLMLQKIRDPIRLLYLEVEKVEGGRFLLPEVQCLKKLLQEELKKHIETLSPSIFGLHNGEEVLRNILTLSKELHDSTDIPQAMVCFDSCSPIHFAFRVILVRVLQSTSCSLSDCFQCLQDPMVEFIPERTSIVGYVGGQAKEASVFRLQITHSLSLTRTNSSLNLYQARKRVLSLLTKAVGEVRDYNGGLFSKQAELFAQFKDHFKKHAEVETELLEDFFYSLNPIEMQAVIPFASLVQLFELFLQALSERLPQEESYVLKAHRKDQLLFTIVYCRDFSIKETLTGELQKRQHFAALETWFFVKTQLGTAVGYIHHSFSEEQQQAFFQVIEKTLEKWSSERKNIQTLRLSLNHLIVSLDPRTGGDEISSIVLKGLFEGLMRMDKEGNPSLAIAESVEISEDGKNYLFRLRKCFWNNGDGVVAQDFCYAWKTALSPRCATSFAYLFYVLKNAKAVRKGQAALNALGCTALDDQTLLVELEHPCDYFLELLAHPLFSPIHHIIDQVHPNWLLQTGQAYVCNGPFQLKNTSPREAYELEKNVLYWDAKSVHLDRILISKSSAQKALELLKKDEIDLLGLPLRAVAPSFSPVSHRNPLRSISWCLFNTQSFLFQSCKIRQALSMAIDRQKIRDLLSYDASPAFTPLPLAHTQHPELCIHTKDNEAVALFEEGLKELGVSRHQLHSLTCIHANNALRTDIALAIAQQWKQTLGITIDLQGYNFQELFSKLTQGNYQIGIMSWKPLINDPLYSLNIFRYSSEEINFSKWEHREYQQWLDLADDERDPQKRKSFLKEAEAILIQEAPLIPLFYEETLQFMRKNPQIGHSVTENIDFKYFKVRKNKKGI